MPKAVTQCGNGVHIAHCTHIITTYLQTKLEFYFQLPALSQNKTEYPHKKNSKLFRSKRMQGAQKPDRNCCFRSICDNLCFLYAEIQIVYGIVWGLSLCYVAYLGNCLTRDFQQFYINFFNILRFGSNSGLSLTTTNQHFKGPMWPLWHSHLNLFKFFPSANSERTPIHMF